MAGGLLSLVSEGQQNIILNSNPSKTFWKSTYSKYTNFGLQKFRIDYEGAKTLHLTEDSVFTFKVPRYGDLMMDTYLAINLPNIWSPILPPQLLTKPDGTQYYTDWTPYEFQWIENIGAQMIRQITITCGNQKLQEYSGNYLLAESLRDFTDRTALFQDMIGNIPQLNNPAAYFNGSYPNAYYDGSIAGPDPSIKGRTLYIPLNNWFTFNSQMAFPLVALQYNELQITITFRPIFELFRIHDVFDFENNFPLVAPNFNKYYSQMYRFLQPPPDSELGINSYLDKRSIWNTDIHLISTYCFLSNDEQQVFAKNEQSYLIRQVHETVFYNVTGPNKIQLDSVGLVSSWMWFMQRSDANLRNEWSNYSNWPYNGVIPNQLIPAPVTGNYILDDGQTIGPGINPDGSLTNLSITEPFSFRFVPEILVFLGILMDGQYRENLQPAGVFNYIEKYTRTPGNLCNGLYCYNFCLSTSPYNLQPSGALNTNRFSQLEFEFTTIIPPLDPFAQVLTICDPESGQIIGVNKPTWRIYDYNYNFYLMEERLNVVTFVAGNAGLLYAN